MFKTIALTRIDRSTYLQKFIDFAARREAESRRAESPDNGDN